MASEVYLPHEMVAILERWEEAERMRAEVAEMGLEDPGVEVQHTALGDCVRVICRMAAGLPPWCRFAETRAFEIAGRRVTLAPNAQPGWYPEEVRVERFEVDPVDAVRELREAGGSAWDAVEDPAAYLAEIRGEEPTQPEATASRLGLDVTLGVQRLEDDRRTEVRVRIVTEDEWRRIDDPTGTERDRWVAARLDDGSLLAVHVVDPDAGRTWVEDAPADDATFARARRLRRKLLTVLEEDPEVVTVALTPGGNGGGRIDVTYPEAEPLRVEVGIGEGRD